jgi:hypothetical protein
MLNLDKQEEFIFEDDWVYCCSYPSARVSFAQTAFGIGNNLENDYI